MRRITPLLAAALLTGALTIFIPLRAEAGAVLPAANPMTPALSAATLLTPAGYYTDYRQKSDDYRDEGDYGYGDDDYGDDGYKHHRHHYCGTRYENKYVCDQTEPRCFRQRECIWEYGREYCRNVRKCVGGERYCKWVPYPVNDCGY
jgi:hypothetical protein